MNKRTCLKALKILISLTFIACVIYIYGIEIFTKFGNKATVFISTTLDAKDFTMPPITICMQNGVKPPILKMHGGKTAFHYVFDIGSNQDIASVWDSYRNASYLLGRDFEIDVLLPIQLNEPVQTGLLVGNNMIGDGILDNPIVIIIHEYHTLLSGTCYGIESNISIKPPISVRIDLRFNRSINQEEHPQVKKVRGYY